MGNLCNIIEKLQLHLISISSFSLLYLSWAFISYFYEVMQPWGSFPVVLSEFRWEVTLWAYNMGMEEDSWENTKNTSGRSCLVPRPPPPGKRSPRQQQCKMFELETLNVSLIESDHAFATLSDQNGHLAGLSDPFKKEKLLAVDE